MKLYRNLIIFSVIVIVLVAAIVCVYKITPSQEEQQPQENTASETISVYEVDSDTIAKVTVTTDEYSYDITKSGDTLKLSNENGLRLSKSKLQSLIYSCSAITASEIITDVPEDAHKFGFNNVNKSVTIHTTDGKSQTILIGDMTLDNKSGYIKLADSDKIYLKSAYGIENLTPKYTDFVDKSILKIDSSNLSVLKHVYISKSGNTPVKLEYTSEGSKNKWKMTAPVYADVNGQVLADHVLTPLGEFSAVDVAEAHVADKSKYDFANPYATFSIDYNNTVTKLIFGKKYNDYRFVMIEGFDSVYTVKESALSFLDVPYQNLMSLLIHVEYIDEISKVEILSADTDIIMEINDNEYKINGKVIEKKAFSKAYQAVIGISLDSVNTNLVPAQNYDATIKYTKKDGSVVTVGFIPVDERNYHVLVDGKGSSITAKKNFNEAIDFVLKTYKSSK